MPGAIYRCRPAHPRRCRAVTEALRFWALLELIGLGAAPIAGVLLARLPGAGLGLGKVLGLALVTWLVWIGGATLLVAWSPDVWLTEKPMDMAFLNAANRAETFPPEDPWFAGADLNYYYLGHLAMAVLVKLGDLPGDEGYNVAVAGLLALTATAVFTLAATLWAAARGPQRAVRAGLGAVALIVVLGNLEGARLLVADGGPLRDYDWFAASRVIDDAITEFPWFSFLLGDLHAHVLAVPFTVLALAFAVQVVLDGPRLEPRGRAIAELVAAALSLGLLYAVNAWSYPVTAGVLALAVVGWLRDWRSRPVRPAVGRWLLATLAASAL